MYIYILFKILVKVSIEYINLVQMGEIWAICKCNTTIKTRSFINATLL